MDSMGGLTVNYFVEEMGEEELAGWARPFGQGPYFKAKMDFDSFKIIYEDTSLLTGPGCPGDTPYEPICLGCNEVIVKPNRCLKCKWPLCSRKCSKKSHHVNYECKIFAQNGVRELQDPFQYELVRILRALLTKAKDPERFEKLESLYGATQVRMDDEDLLEATRTAVMFIQQNCNRPEFDEALINQICGVIHLQTRAFGRTNTGMEIFPIAAKLLHSCDANTRFIDTLSPSGAPMLRLVATRPVKKGEPFTQRLVLSTKPTYSRQDFLREHYYFTCTCVLCKDPTERGTYFSAVKCLACKASGKTGRNQGHLVPVDIFGPDLAWQCTVCKTTKSSDSIFALFKHIVTEFNEAVPVLTRQHKIKFIRMSIKQAEQRFHQSNYIVWYLKRCLVMTLCQDLMETASLRKTTHDWNSIHAIFTEIHELSMRTMTILQLLYPGSTVERGEILHDLVEATGAYFNLSIIFGKSGASEVTAVVKKLLKFHKEVIDIFDMEFVSGKKEMSDSMRDIVAQIGRITGGSEKLLDLTEAFKNMMLKTNGMPCI